MVTVDGLESLKWKNTVNLYNMIANHNPTTLITLNLIILH